MKVSELIKKLEQFKTSYGDLPVFMCEGWDIVRDPLIEADPMVYEECTFEVHGIDRPECVIFAPVQG